MTDSPFKASQLIVYGSEVSIVFKRPLSKRGVEVNPPKADRDSHPSRDLRRAVPFTADAVLPRERSVAVPSAMSLSKHSSLTQILRSHGSCGG